MKEISVKQRICNVLIENENGYLNIEEIAKIGFAEAYLKVSQKHYNGLIKRNITHAIAQLLEDDYIVITRKYSTENSIRRSSSSVSNNGKEYDKFKVIGYKIADNSKDDKAAVLLGLIDKSQRISIHLAKQDEFALKAKENKVIDESKIKTNYLALNTYEEK